MTNTQLNEELNKTDSDTRLAVELSNGLRLTAVSGRYPNYTGFNRSDEEVRFNASDVVRCQVYGK